ncbi:MAG: carbon-nitrogen hydrolase [Polyangiaceae bacterium]|nr:carbon-nitrogen hydrolase [Polyangiaceae bacterium]
MTGQKVSSKSSETAGAPSDTLRLGLVQSRYFGSVSETIEAARRGVLEAVRRGAELICLQELYSGPYFCQSEDPDAFTYAESCQGQSVAAMRALAQEYHVSINIPFFESRAPGLFHNSSVIALPNGKLVGHYRKMHIPDDPQFMEKYYFTPGDRGFVAVSTPGVKVGPLICWDQWYPEAARLTAMKGAQVLLYPTAIGWLAGEKEAEGEAQLQAWQTMQRSHAIANGVFVAAVNRVGLEPHPRDGRDAGIEFWGHSFVVDPTGRMIAEAGEDEEVLVVDCDLSLIG